MPTTRLRTFSEPPILGYSIGYQPPSTVVHSTYPLIKDCLDVVGNWPHDNPFNVEEIRVTPGKVNGSFKDPYGNPLGAHIDVPHDNMDAPAHLTLLSSPLSVVEASTLGVARTGPGRPVVSLPVLLGELKSSFFNLFEMGEKKSRKQRHKNKSSSNSVAEINFGWAPLFGDLQKLLNFQEQLDDRVRELNALHSKGGLKRHWTTWTDTNRVSSPNTIIWSLRGVYSAHLITETHARQWVSTRWRPKRQSHVVTPREIRDQAARAIHGWRISPSDAWQLMPWSWFLDYFGNVGDYLEAASNMAEFNLESCCVMQRTYTRKRVFAGKWTSYYAGYSLVRGTAERTTKNRKIGSVGITATQPILSAQQVVTLAGIIANR